MSRSTRSLLTLSAAFAALSFSNEPTVTGSAPASRGLAARARAAQTPELQALELLGADGTSRAFTVVLDGAPQIVHIRPAIVRTKSFRLYLDLGRGELVEAAAPRARAYRGELAGVQGSYVTATVTEAGLRASLVDPGSGRAWQIEPATDRTEPGSATLHRVRSDELEVGTQRVCGADRPGEPISRNAGDGGSPLVPHGRSARGAVPGTILKSGSLHLCELAIDCDSAYFQHYGSDIEDTLDAVDARINGANVPTESYLGVSYRLSAVIVRTSAQDDPYAAYQCSDPYGYTYNCAEELRELVKQQWETHHVDVSRDVANLFTDKYTAPFAGINGIGSTCDCVAPYGWVAAALFSDRWNDTLLAHELGHAIGAQHCDSAPEGCWIMCSTLFGCSQGGFGNPPSLIFGSTTISEVASYVAGASCLTEELPTSAPVLSTIVPDEVEQPFPGQIALTGSGFLDAHFMTIYDGTSVYDVGQCSFDVLSDTSMTFQPALAPVVGPYVVSVSNAAGRSNSKTYELLPTDPPVLTGPSAKYVGELIQWGLYGAPSANAELLQAVDDASTASVGGFQVLASGLPIAYLGLDGAGHGEHSVTAASAWKNHTLYTQFVTYDPVSEAITSASNVVATSILAIVGGGGGH